MDEDAPPRSSTPRLRVWLLEPYSSGSHRAWAEGFRAHSQHQVVPLVLPGRFWKWRMHGGAVTLARQALSLREQPHVILATDMLDLTTFLALTRERCHDVPAALYFHENQLTYPLQPGEKRDLHYGFMNFASALAAQKVLFNSAFHMESFFEELPRLLKHFPDYNELQEVERLRARSAVVPLGLDLRRLDAHRPQTRRSGRPLILWNHRWEYDKDPETFFRAIDILVAEGLDFGLILLGESFRQKPQEFLDAQRQMPDRIVQFGYARNPRSSSTPSDRCQTASSSSGMPGPWRSMPASSGRRTSWSAQPSTTSSARRQWRPSTAIASPSCPAGWPIRNLFPPTGTSGSSTRISKGWFRDSASGSWT